jgi:protein-disulfide isomerase
VNTRTSQRGLRLLYVSQAVLLSVIFLATSCNSIGKKAEKPGKTGDKDKDKKEQPVGPCGEYADSLCKAVGPETATCRSIKATTELMPIPACKAGMADMEFSKKKIAEQRKKCDELMNKLCADLGKETETCKMVQTETPKFAPERCEMMLRQYKAVLDDLKRQEEANKPLTPEKRASIEGGTGPSFGPKDAKVVIVEFSDFQCPFCSRAAKTVKQIKEKYGEKVRFVFRQYPLSFHKNANIAAQASLAAHAQGKFWEYHDLMFENQQALEQPKLEEYAAKVKLDVKAFKAAMTSEATKKAVAADLETGNQVGVRGTPSMFVNGARVRNAGDFDELSKQIEKMLK